MARDNDKGLYLPLKIDLAEWEKELATADADLQKALREMRSAVSDLRLQYDVKIAGAKAAGDQLRVLELETAKLNQLYEVQQAKVRGLSQAYEQLVKSEGASSQKAQDLMRTLAREQKEMYRLQGEINKIGQGLGSQISDAIAGISPSFAKARASVSTVTAGLGKLEAAGLAGAAAMTALGVAVASVAAVEGMNRLTDSVDEIAHNASSASEEIFALRENFNLTTEEAEKLHAIAKVDGVSVDALATAMRKLNKQLETAGEDGNLASETLEKYGVSLKRADGSTKSITEQVEALAQGYQRAKEAGDDLNFVTNTLGSGGSQFTHLLNGMPDYVEAVKAIGYELGVDYDKLHLVEQKTNEAKLAMQQVAIVKGAMYSDSAIAKANREIEMAKDLKEYYDQHARQLKVIDAGVTQWGRLIDGLAEKVSLFFQDVILGWQTIASFLGGEAAGKLADWLGLPQANTQTKNLQAEMKKLKPAETTTPTTKTLTKDEKKALKEREEAEKKLQQAQERFAKELRDLRSNEYQKEINALNDKLEAYRKEGISEVQLAELYAEQKSAIDEKYTKKAIAELQKQSKANEDAYKKQAEDAKKAREAAISDAEATMRQNLKVLRFAEKQRQAGNTNWQAETMAYAERQYMKQNGFRASDFSALQNIGVGVLKQLADAQSRLFAQFAPGGSVGGDTITNNNTTTVNIDRPILTDEAMLNALQSRILDNIVPVIERTINNATGNQMGTA